jgi:lipopolysaccharide transport system ATP-binding protein
MSKAQEIIRVEGLSKAYPIYKRPVDFLLEALTGKVRHDTFWALKDVNFSMRVKDRIGIIGPNGSGKSTLLKILTGHLTPSIGTYQVNGKVSAMLSLNTVLNPEETGLSNIKFNLLLNGCSQDQIEDKTQEIIEFTELGPFIYAPVKTYSSGMNAKLAFAITTSIDPEILVIDEVLSVGDAYFMGKATQRMKELCERGNGLLFVSHSTAAVQMLCDKVLWMENGVVRMFGEASHVLALYEEDYRRQEDLATRIGNQRNAKKHAFMTQVSDVKSSDVIRVRLTGDNDRALLADSHYVASISLRSERESLCIPITLVDPNVETAWLDILGSEWGRMYEHNGRDCRLLSSRTGKSRGGHILLPAPTQPGRYVLEVTSRSIGDFETLALEYVDLQEVRWTRSRLVERKFIDGGWFRTTYSFDVAPVTTQTQEVALARIKAATRSAIVIESVALKTDGKYTSIVPERAPFSIEVCIQINLAVSNADVGIKFTRSDGVYAFWQSSGLTGADLVSLEVGRLIVCFEFDQNPFGSGDFSVNAYVANGWDFPSNYPYSEVFDRKVGAFQFKVMPEVAGLDMGFINQRARITSRRGD